jgi:tetratricopeptide (TPR) repeat protein
LINLSKFSEAFSYSKKLEKRKLDSFESDLIIGIYYLKNENFELAQKYFNKIKNRKSQFILNSFVSNSLSNWVSFKKINLDHAQTKIDLIDSRFENLKKIQGAFLHCYYQSDQTDIFFKKLTSNTKKDFSRYNYFYINYLVNSNQINEARKVISSSLELYPRNVLLNQYKLDFSNEKLKKNFNCQKISHVIAEILYITANALSSQSIYSFSNFYLNLAKYLNSDFKSFDALLAENFYKIKNYQKAKKIYNKIKQEGSAYLWYAAKQNAKILIKEDKRDNALKLITETFEKLLSKGPYEMFDYAEFLKNNDQFEKSIKYYSKIMQTIKRDHPLYPEVTDGRGIAYEQIGEWDKAEKDFLNSLDSNPNQAYVINYLAYSWIEKGINIEQSLKMLKKANSLKSNDPYIIDSLGWALYKLKKYKESKSYLQVAVQLIPDDPIVSDHYGDVLWMNGQEIEARYYWNYVLNLNDVEDDLKNNVKTKLVSGL